MAVKIVALSCSSASTNSTSLPALAHIAARLVAMVVLPLPPLIPPHTSIIVALPPYQRSVEMALKQYKYSATPVPISRQYFTPSCYRTQQPRYAPPTSPALAHDKGMR